MGGSIYLTGRKPHEARRKSGVSGVLVLPEFFSFCKNILDSSCRFGKTPLAPVSAFPRERSNVPLSYPHAELSQRGVPVSANIEKESMNSLEMDRELIRCKTCGLVQYRTRTGNCPRCVRALPQRLEFLIPPAPPEEVQGEEAVTDKFANQKTLENIGQRIRQLREC